MRVIGVLCVLCAHVCMLHACGPVGVHGHMRVCSPCMCAQVCMHLCVVCMCVCPCVVCTHVSDMCGHACVGEGCSAE